MPTGGERTGAESAELLAKRLEDACDEARSLLREVRGCTKDLRAAVHDGRRSFDELKEDFGRWVRKEWEGQEALQLIKAIREMYEHWAEATEKVDALTSRYQKAVGAMARLADEGMTVRLSREEGDRAFGPGQPRLMSPRPRGR